MPAGAATVSFLIEQQKSRYGQGAQWNNPGTPSELMAIFPPRSQDVRSAYAELRVPLFGKANARPGLQGLDVQLAARYDRSEEHTSELQSLMRISYAVFCLKKKKNR